LPSRWHRRSWLNASQKQHKGALFARSCCRNDFSAGIQGHAHGRETDTTGRSMNENALSRLDASSH